MGISGFKFNTKFEGLTSWFMEIAQILGHDNFSNGSWTPTFTNLTGSPTVTGNYTKISDNLNFLIIVNGDSQMSSSTMNNLPFTAKNYGIVTVLNQTDNSLIGHGYIDNNSVNIYLPDWNLTSKNIIIQGNVKITGI